MSKKFEYELTLRMEKAEQAIAGLASKIEKDLGNAVNKVFSGSSEFDVGRFTKNLGSRIEQDVGNGLAKAFSGASEFDYSKRIASAVESDLRNAVKAAFSGSSEFDFADPGKASQQARERAQIRSEERQREVQGIEDQRDFELRAGQEVLDAERAFRQEREQDESEWRKNKANWYAKQAEDERKANEENWEAQRKATEEQAEFDRKQAEADRELQRQINQAGYEDQKNQMDEQARKAAEQADENARQGKADLERISNNSKALKDYYANYKDPSALSAIQAVQKSLDRHSESLKTSGLEISEQNKLHKEYTQNKLEALDKVIGKDKQEADNRIEQIRKSEAATSEANKVRYEGHHEVLKRIEAAEQQNASELAKIEANVTNMTKQELKDRLAAYNKMAAATIAHAKEAGFHQEDLLRQGAARNARAVAGVFQAQQVVEDTLAAGFRGAGNNIAFMLSQMTTGWVAVAGLTVVAGAQIAHHLGLFEKLNEAMGEYLWKSEKRAKLEQEAAEHAQYVFNLKTKQMHDFAEFDPSKTTASKLQADIAAAERSKSIDQERMNRLERFIKLYEEAKSLADAMAHNATIEGRLNLGGLTPRTPEEMLDAAKQGKLYGGHKGGMLSMLDPTGMTNEQFNDYLKQMQTAQKMAEEMGLGLEFTGDNAAKAKADFEAYKKEISDTIIQVELLQKELERTKLEKPLFDEIDRATKEDPFKTARGLGHGADDIISVKAEVRAKKLNDLAEEYREKIINANNDENKRLALLDEHGEKVREINRQYEAVSENLNEQKSLINDFMTRLEQEEESAKETLKAREDILRAIEKEISATERSIEATQKHRDALEREQSAREDAAGGEEVGFMSDIIDVQASEKSSKIKENFDAGAKAIEAHADKWEQWIKRAGKARGDAWKQEMLERLNWEKDQILKQAGFREESQLKTVAKNAEAAKAANLKAYEILQRQKFNALNQEGQQALNNNDFNAANEAFEKAQKILQELRDSQVHMLKEKDSEKQMKDAFAEIKKIDKELKDLNQQQQQLDNLKEESDRATLENQQERQAQEERRIERLKTKIEEIGDAKKMVGMISLNNPSDPDALDNIIEQFRLIQRLKTSISGIPLTAGTEQPATGPIQSPAPPPGAGPNGSTGMGGGGGVPTTPNAAGYSTVFNLNVNNGTPMAAMAAAQAAAANLMMQRS